MTVWHNLYCLVYTLLRDFSTFKILLVKLSLTGSHRKKLTLIFLSEWVYQSLLIKSHEWQFFIQNYIATPISTIYCRPFLVNHWKYTAPLSCYGFSLLCWSHGQSKYYKIMNPVGFIYRSGTDPQCIQQESQPFSSRHNSAPEDSSNTLIIFYCLFCVGVYKLWVFEKKNGTFTALVWLT